MKESVLCIEGIMCPNCVKKIKTVLLARDEIKTVEVAEDYQTVRVLYDEETIDTLRIGMMIEQIENKSFKHLFKGEPHVIYSN
ncbi:heavy-metal-associated domain-containing protein [Eubacteriaceae bacterium ES2]|nr:heavy-metal-associated domain-containing protein [Eubacteriaceae bacterium ES2]